MSVQQPSDELARLREELAREEADLAALEGDVETHSAQLGYLHTEYTLNKTRLCHHFEPRLQPLRVITHAAAQKESLIALQIEWLERKVVEQERRSQGGGFVEVRDMKAVAEEHLNVAHQSVLRSYEHISECPEEALAVISQYACPPDEAIATMELVMKVRGEAPEDCTWSASQVILSYTYFHDFFVTRSESLLQRCELLSDVRMSELEAFCASPHHSIPALYRISTPIGCMGEWLHALRNYYRVKIVTAPVLLSNSEASRQRGEEVQAWLNMITLGEGSATPAAAEASQSAKIASPSSSPVAPAPADEMPSDEAQCNALVTAYASLKDGLGRAVVPASVTMDIVHQLRHRLHRIREGARAADEERIALEAELQAQLEEVRGNYDETMVPLQDHLEETTECFAQRIMHKSDVLVILPPPADAAAAAPNDAADDTAIVAAE